MIKIDKKVNGAIILCGFQSKSLVGPVVLQYLEERMNFEKIGFAWDEELPPISALMKGELLKQITILYNKEKNLIILKSLVPGTGNEWKLAEILNDISEKINPEKIIYLDGMQGGEDESNDIFYIGDSGDAEKAGAKKLEDAVLYGLLSAILLRDIKPVYYIFGRIYDVSSESKIMIPSSAQTSSNMISFLNRFIGLEISTQELTEKGKEIEGQLMNQMKNMQVPERPEYLG
ncbi:MAG: PAC2 family protein [Candidatus Woesearchaeota archaeon]